MKTKHFYFFTSSRKSDRLTSLSIYTDNAIKAFAMALAYFRDYGYKGRPVRLAV